MLRVVKNSIIYYLARGVIFVTGLVPRPLVRPVGHALGALAYLLARRERDIARRQLTRHLKLENNQTRLDLLVRGVFRQLGQSAVELCRLLSNPNRRPAVVIPPLSRQALDQALSRGKGVIFATGHVGNWELMAATLSAEGYPISTIAKESYDPRFSRFLERSRAKFGVEAIYRERPGASAGMLRSLRGNRILGILMDQDTRVPGVFVPFFGERAHTPTGGAVLARRTGAPIVLGSIRRTPSGNHVIEISPVPTRGNEALIAAEITAGLEDRIRAHPSQWVWFHRRWKTRPKDNLAETNRRNGARAA